MYYSTQTRTPEYDRQSAYCYKIGKLVFVEARLYISNRGEGSGLKFSGRNYILPYTPAGYSVGALRTTEGVYQINADYSVNYFSVSSPYPKYDADYTDLRDNTIAQFSIVYLTND